MDDEIIHLRFFWLGATTGATLQDANALMSCIINYISGSSVDVNAARDLMLKPAKSAGFSLARKSHWRSLAAIRAFRGTQLWNRRQPNTLVDDSKIWTQTAPVLAGAFPCLLRLCPFAALLPSLCRRQPLTHTSASADPGARGRGRVATRPCSHQQKSPSVFFDVGINPEGEKPISNFPVLAV